MAVMIKCKMCGGDLQLTEGSTVATCEYCGTQQTVPTMDNEKKLVQFERADRLRRNCEFDKAAGVYESIVADFRQEAEAYWGLVLCKYGIEYVDDPATGKKIPTCHRSSFESIMDDPNFEQTLENADAVSRKVYREEAKVIEEIRKGILEVSSKEDPYDIFICYKETDEQGERTLDSVLAQDIYDALTDKGYRVFFSRITLEDKLGLEYEPYIFAALNSAKVMLSIGTDYEYFNAVWVKNEWSRFLKMMEKDKTKHLIPCFKGIDAYDMPKEFNKLQAQDLGKVGAVQDLLRGIDKLIIKEKPAVQPTAQVQTEDINRAFIYNSAVEKGEENKIKSVEAAIEKLNTIAGYSDTDQQIQRLQAKLKKLKTKRLVKRLCILGVIVAIILAIVISVTAKRNAERQGYYEAGLSAMEIGDYQYASGLFTRADGYKDSDTQRAKAEEYLNLTNEAVARVRNVGTFISDDNEILDLSGWNGAMLNIGNGSGDSVSDSAAAATVAPATMPAMEPMEGFSDNTPEKTYFNYDGTFSYNPVEEEYRFKTADGTVYTVDFDGSNLTFRGSGLLDGRVYRPYENAVSANLLENAQKLAANGLYFMARPFAEITAYSGLVSDEEQIMEAEMLLDEIYMGMDAESMLAQELFAFDPEDEDAIWETMDMLTEATMAGDLSGWADALSSGRYEGEALKIALDEYAWYVSEYPQNAPQILLQVAELNPDLAMALDFMMNEHGITEMLHVMAEAGELFY